MKLLLTAIFLTFSFAGFSQTTPPVISTETTLSAATSNDDDGTIVSYSWKQISGPATPLIVNPTGVTTKVTGFDTPGVYVYELTVTDNQGAIGKTTMVVTAYTANKPPNARIVVSPNSFQLPAKP
jgi:hypothetical protein